MKRREFLLGTAAGAVTTLVARAPLFAQHLTRPGAMLFDFQRSSGPVVIDEVELIQVEGHHMVDTGIEQQYGK